MAEGRISRGKFLRFGGALGVGAASASLIAACGTGDPGEAGENGNGEPAGENGNSEAPEEAANGEAIAQESEVPAGSAFEFEDEGEPAVLVHLEDGSFVAYSAVCTHQGCDVSYSEGSATLDCPCHGSVFDPASGGEPTGGPAQNPLPEIPVEVRDGAVVRA
ncbi:MAG: Rieske (2Fe-2S) protein [Rubrobacter sp.]|nr:Rieske (2Fe-2S) protein [Rubrobacter sp.]